MRGTSSTSLGPLPRIDNSQKWGKSLFLKACVRGGRRFVRGVQRRHIALNAVYSPVLFKTRPMRRLVIFHAASSTGSSVYTRQQWRPLAVAVNETLRRVLSPYRTQTTPPTGLLGLGKRRIYHIFNDTASAGPPAGPRGVRPGPLSRLVNLRGISGSALWAKAASRRCYLEK